jgi:protocatechuate 3,4-dioxygenase beta subunit
MLGGLVWTIARPERAAPARADSQARTAVAGAPAATPDGAPPTVAAEDHRPAVRLVVRVEDVRGAPVADATVDSLATTHVHGGIAIFFDFEGRDRTPVVLASRRTDATGTAWFDAPLDATYRFRARAAGLASATSPARALHGALDAAPAVVLRLERGFPLTGRAVDEEGTPLPGVFVWADEERRTTDAKGAFRFDALPPRDVEIHAARPGGAPYLVERIRFPAISDFTVVMPRGGVVRGRVTLAGTGEPVAGARVAVQGGHRAVAHTDADGRYSIDALPPTPCANRLPCR